MIKVSKFLITFVKIVSLSLRTIECLLDFSTPTIGCHNQKNSFFGLLNYKISNLIFF